MAGAITAMAAEVETEDGPVAAILVGAHGHSYCWENSCPHTGAPLDWVPGRFLDPAGRYLQCATHGALFEPTTGLCIAGPCRGDRLKALAPPPSD